MSSKRRKELIKDCEEVMENIPYSATVPGLGNAAVLTTHDLSLFLSDEWINDEMMNAGSQYILHQLGTWNRRRIVNCLLVGSLQSSYRRSPKYQPQQPTMLDHLITSGVVDKLYIPLHISGNHWTLLEADLVERTFAYADSLSVSAAPPSSTLQVLEWWIDQVVLNPLTPRSQFRRVDAKFSMPHQRDNFSCGIVVLSTLAHILLHYSAWTPETYAEERMEWFMRISEYISDNNAPNDEIIVGSTRSLFDVTAANEHYQDPEEPSEGEIDTTDDPVPNGDPTALDCVDIYDAMLNVPPPQQSSPDRLPHIQHPSNLTMSATQPPQAPILSDSEEDSDTHDGRAAKRRKLGAAYIAKAGTSYAMQKALRDRSIEDPHFQTNPQKIHNFRLKIRQDDSHAEFKDNDPRVAQCSACGAWVKM